MDSSTHSASSHPTAIITDCATQLAQTQRELDMLSYAISHDLRAPVRAIAGFSQALKEQVGDSLDTVAQHHLQRIEQSTQRLSEMINGLLRLSRITQADFQPITVDLTLLCQSLVQELQQQHPQFKPHVQIAEHMQACCDPHLLRTVLRELLHNAWKFTSECSHPHIEVNATTDEGITTLCVRDNGMGFDMRYAERLFVPFQHMHSRADLIGLGIGLACAQRIVHRHSGKLWADAATQHGACFCLTLPSAA